MNVQVDTIAYKKGEVYLCDNSHSALLIKRLREVEIVEVNQDAKAVLVREDEEDEGTWQLLVDFHKTVKGYLGVYKTEGKWLWKRRKLVKVAKR